MLSRASTMLRHLLACSLALTLASCLGTRLVNLANIDVAVPPPQPGADWRADLDVLLERYENAPVLAPEDARLEPLFGGLTTLSFFGADALPRVRDQQLAPGSARGEDLAQACEQPSSPAASARALQLTDDPRYVPVWMPLAIRGGLAATGVRCDERGHPIGEGAQDSFCMFGRLALQSGPAPVIMVVHGLFDSGAQDYVQRLAAVLFRLGHSVLLPDMRDHGDTLRAAPQLSSTLGTLEGADLLALSQLTRQTCGERVTRVGITGVSGGGMDAIHALIADRTGLLDAGVLALSPLLDVEQAIRDLSDTGDCAIPRSVELTWTDDLLLAAATGIGFFGGAAVSDLTRGERLDGHTALAGGMGFGLGLATAAVVDAFFDGGAEACVSQSAIARIVQDCLHMRWSVLQATRNDALLSPAGRRISPEDVALTDYMRERVQFLARQDSLPLRPMNAIAMARALRSALSPTGARPKARLLVLGADDDPMTRKHALHSFIEHAQGIPQIHARAVQHGGHGSLWVVQPTIVKAIFERFFTGAAAPAGSR